MSASSRWLTIPGGDESGVLSALAQRIDARLKSAKLTSSEVAYISTIPLRGVECCSTVSAGELERIRALCQSWDVNFRPFEIRSHRKIIGPLIVYAKKLLFPLVRIFMKDLIRDQREFNAKVILALIEFAKRDGGGER